MLYLIVKKDDYLVFNIPGHGEVEVRVIDSNNKSVKLGMDFPKSMEVWRSAVWKRKKAERELNAKWKSEKPVLKLKR